MAPKFKRPQQIIAKAALAVFATAASMACVGCGDDYEFDYTMDVNVNYSITLGEAWLDFYDVNISYSIGGSVSQAVAVGDWSYSINLPNMDMSEISPRYTFEVVASLKDDYPEIDQDAVYDFSSDYSVSVRGEREDETVFYDNSSQGSTLYVAGSDLSLYLKTKERVLVSYSRTFDPDSVYK